MFIDEYESDLQPDGPLSFHNIKFTISSRKKLNPCQEIFETTELIYFAEKYRVENINNQSEDTKIIVTPGHQSAADLGLDRRTQKHGRVT